jgi:predicted small lipoprotein YifL
MRSGFILGIMAILFLLLEGCGHKGPLKLPAPQAQIPQAPTTSPQTLDSPKPDMPPSQQIKQP